MKIELSKEEQDDLLKLAHDTKFSTAKIKETLESIHQANFYEDVKDVIQYLEEDEE